MATILVKEAVCAGAHQSRACAILGISCRTLRRWRSVASLTDQRTYPKPRKYVAFGEHTLTRPAFAGLVLFGGVIVLRAASDAAAVHGSGYLAGWVAVPEYRQDRPADH